MKAADDKNLLREVPPHVGEQILGALGHKPHLAPARSTCAVTGWGAVSPAG